jgi:hypothetical protein
MRRIRSELSEALTGAAERDALPCSVEDVIGDMSSRWNVVDAFARGVLTS